MVTNGEDIMYPADENTESVEDFVTSRTDQITQLHQQVKSLHLFFLVISDNTVTHTCISKTFLQIIWHIV